MKFAHLLRYGLAAGAAAGLSAALVMYLVVEPVIRRALTIESARETRLHEHPEELVSRPVQVGFGMLTTVVVGMLFGLVFTVVFAKVRHQLPGGSEQGRAVRLATLGFLVFVLVPALRIPANPPSVGDPATITRRTLIYLLTVLLSVLAAGLLFALDQRLGAVSPAVRRLVVVGAGVGCFVALMLLVPASPDRIPRDVPAGLIWDFRIASLGQLLALWGVLGLGFGALAERSRTTTPTTSVPV